MGKFNPEVLTPQMPKNLFNKKGKLNPINTLILFDTKIGIHVAVNVLCAQFLPGLNITFSILPRTLNYSSIFVYNPGKKSFEFATKAQEDEVVARWGIYALNYIEYEVSQHFRMGTVVQEPSSLKLQYLIGQSESIRTTNQIDPRIVAENLGVRVKNRELDPRVRLVHEINHFGSTELRSAYKKGLEK